MIWDQLVMCRVHVCLSVAGLMFYADQECILTFDLKFKCRNLIMNTEIMIPLFGFHPDFPNFPNFKWHYHTWKPLLIKTQFLCLHYTMHNSMILLLPNDKLYHWCLSCATHLHHRMKATIRHFTSTEEIMFI